MNELAAKIPKGATEMVRSLLGAEGVAPQPEAGGATVRLEGHRVPPRRIQTNGKKAMGLAINAI